MILIVDDNEVILEMQVAVLQSAGHQVMTANNGDSALAIIKEHSPKLILMDITMPGLTGYQVLDEVRQMYGDEIPVVLVSALPEDEERDTALAHGATDYISKPFEIPTIISCASKYLQNNATA